MSISLAGAISSVAVSPQFLPGDSSVSNGGKLLIRSGLYISAFAIALIEALALSAIGTILRGAPL